MGDVFDAMNRAREQRRGKSDNWDAPQQVARPPADGETPALPMDQIVQAPEAPDDNSPAPPVPPVVTAAQHKAQVEAADAQTEAHDDRPASLNGYASQIVTHHDRGSVITEQYRAIRTQILARGRNRKLQTTVITSAAPNEGKSVTTINLGITFSELRNKKTVIIEGDLRRPTFDHLLHREGEKGLLQWLRGEVDDLDTVLHRTVYDNLQFLPAGGYDSVASTELLSSPKMLQTIDRLKDRYDHIFIDTPPILNVTDAGILGAVSDQTILVVRLNRTPSDVIERAKRLLRAANCEVAGVVLTHLTQPLPRYLNRYAY